MEKKIEKVSKIEAGKIGLSEEQSIASKVIPKLIKMAETRCNYE